MLNWLRADLDADRARCELAIFHEPAFATPAPWGGKKAMRTPWWTMELRGVDLVVTGHNHAYERFAQQDHLGRRSTRGIRSVVAGTAATATLPSAARSRPTAWSAMTATTGCYG